MTNYQNPNNIPEKVITYGSKTIDKHKKINITVCPQCGNQIDYSNSKRFCRYCRKNLIWGKKYDKRHSNSY